MSKMHIHSLDLGPDGKPWASLQPGGDKPFSVLADERPAIGGGAAPAPAPDQSGDRPLDADALRPRPGLDILFCAGRAQSQIHALYGIRAGGSHLQPVPALVPINH